ncbi:MAG: Hsp20 family protein [Pseudomonadota bacterium]
MNTIDLSPLYRTMVGIDRMASMLDTAARLDGAQGYPPYNIERVGDDRFTIEIAVAGFGEADLDIELKESLLTVAGKKNGGDSEAERDFLHRGIAERGFIRRFQLADHVMVRGASLENGLLKIDLQRELPDAAKPRKIAIGGAASAETPKLIAGGGASAA